jgi:hypothetical protein
MLVTSCLPGNRTGNSVFECWAQPTALYLKSRAVKRSKVAPVHARKKYRRTSGGGTAALILHLGAVNFTLRPLYSRERIPLPIE